MDMKQPHLFDKIDLQLIRTLHTLLIERSVSKTAMRLGQQQPAVSVALKRLRELIATTREQGFSEVSDFVLEHTAGVGYATPISATTQIGLSIAAISSRVLRCR